MVWIALAALPALAVPATPRDYRLPGDNVVFHANLDEHGSYSDVWGYTSPGGREYALLGAHDGVAIIDVTHRRRPVEVAFVPGPGSAWRDIKTYGHHMYVVNETGGGLQIVSLADPARPAVVNAGWGGFSRAHNLHIDEAAGTAFIAGRDVTGGVQILRLLSPSSPSIAGTWDVDYVHDVFARAGVLYASAIYAGRLYMLDLENLATPSVRGIVGPYPGAFTHNAWPTDDGRHVLTTDERSGASLRMWDVSDPANPSLTSLWRPAGGRNSIPHNVHVKGNLAFVSWYTAGVRVVDVANPDEMVEAAWYDTFPQSDVGTFAGCWGVFPFYPASPRLFVASDIGRGLFVLELEEGVGAPAGAGRRTAEPPAVRLDPPRPSPLRDGSARIELSLAEAGRVTVDVLDAAGRRVRGLADREAPAGRTRLAWDGRDDAGRRVAAGTYFVRAEAGGRASARKIVVTR